MIVALTREVPWSIERCELTHRPREPIDVRLARAQHAAYEQALREEGARVQPLAPEPELPDSVFVEDTAVILDDLAVLCRPGAPSRRREVAGVRDALAALRPLEAIAPPATLDGGDVLVLDDELVVGISSRTSAEGAAALGRCVSRTGRRVRTIAVRNCLHLKSAATRVAERTLLVNPRFIDEGAFPGWQVVTVDPSEPGGANALWLGGRVIYPAEFPRTLRRLERAGCSVRPVEAGELAKAEGGVTCCCLLLQ